MVSTSTALVSLSSSSVLMSMILMVVFLCLMSASQRGPGPVTYGQGSISTQTVTKADGSKVTVTEIDTARTNLQCPPNWAPCDDSKFAQYKPSVGELLDSEASTSTTKVKNLARAYCCKLGGAANDPRPEMIAKVKSKRKFWGVLLTVLDTVGMLLSFLPAGRLVSTALNAGSAAVSAANLGVMIKMGAGGAVPFDEGIPMTDCQMPNNMPVKRSNPKALYRHEFVDENGDKAVGFWQSDNGCPVNVMEKKMAVYTHQLVEAGKTKWKFFNDEWDVLPLTEFDPAKAVINCKRKPGSDGKVLRCDQQPMSQADFAEECAWRKKTGNPRTALPPYCKSAAAAAARPTTQQLAQQRFPGAPKPANKPAPPAPQTANGVTTCASGYKYNDRTAKCVKCVTQMSRGGPTCTYPCVLRSGKCQ